MGEKVLCYDCYYYSVTRYGKTCSFNGEFNPCKNRCPNYKQRETAEKAKLESVEGLKLMLSIIN